MSSVLYLRGIFPEHTFRDAEITTVRVRNLDPNADDVLARQLCSFVEDGLLKAIELKVLSSVDLLISRSGSQPGDLLEKYTFVFSSAGELAMGGDPIKSVQMMLRKLLITTETCTCLLECFVGDDSGRSASLRNACVQWRRWSATCVFRFACTTSRMSQTTLNRAGSDLVRTIAAGAALAVRVRHWRLF